MHLSFGTKKTLKTKPDNEGEPPKFIQTMLKLLINIDKQKNHTISIQWLIKNTCFIFEK